jgi:hypothetical protein
MATVDDDIRRGFIAERRNLLITSVALFLVQYSEIVFDEINLLGNKATIKDSTVIPFLLWIFWLYFGLRYYHHFREANTQIWATYDSTFHSFLVPVARKRFEHNIQPAANFKGMERSHVEYHTTVRQKPGLTRVNMDVEGYVFYKLPSGGPGYESIRQTIELRWADLLLPHLRAAFYLFLNTRLVLEYLLPFAVALLPLGDVLGDVVLGDSSGTLLTSCVSR